MFHFKASPYQGPQSHPPQQTRQPAAATVRRTSASNVPVPAIYSGDTGITEGWTVQPLQESSQMRARNILRKRSQEEQQEVSRAKALELSDRYELSDVKLTDLNKNGVFRREGSSGSASLSSNIMTPAQAMAMLAKEEQRQQQEPQSRANPLRQPHELKPARKSNKDAAMERRKKIAEYQARRNGAVAIITPTSSYDQDSAIEVVEHDSMTDVRTESIEPRTISPRGAYRASNGKIYRDIPNLC